MIYRVRSAVASAWVKGGAELLDLAAGRITLGQIVVRQPELKPRRIDPLKRLAAFLLLAILPVIAAAKDSHPSSSHPKPTHVANSHKVTRHRTADHSSLKNVRSASAKRNFQASNPCPATGKTSGSCKGYVIDHKTPLACGGADSPENMQWQTSAEAKLKDRTERAGCAP